METIDMRGWKGLIVGIANEHSLAWSAARHCHAAGAEVAVNYLNDKARRFVEPLARQLGATIFLPCNIATPGELEELCQSVNEERERLAFMRHSMAWARGEELHDRLADCSAATAAEPTLIFCHSFIRIPRVAEPLMSNGGSSMTASYYGAGKMVNHNNVLGPVKVGLEASERYRARELGGTCIRDNAISLGALGTRAAPGIEHFDEILNESMRKAPLRRTAYTNEVGRIALVLASTFGSAFSGEILHTGAGFHIEGRVFQ